MKRFSTLIGILLYLSTALAVAQSARTEMPDARMLRFPDVSAEKIVFVYAGDLWTVSKEGGLAKKLSSPKGQELFPKFSPDGQTIAFSGNYDGNTDVYIMPASGGKPKRLTHHSADDLVVEWYPNGKHILYRSRMISPSRRFNRFFKQSVGGGLPETLALAYGELASFSPDGNRMAFQFLSREFRNWKRYRGGWASDIWLYDFINNTSEQLTEFEGTDSLPMWHQNTIYFLSDRDIRKKMNIWAYDLGTKKFRQLTKFSEYDVKWPSIGPDAIVFENGGKLHLLNLVSEVSRPIHIQVPADLPQVRTKLKDVSKKIENFTISPTGKRALFEARGEILTVPQEHGSIRNLTNTSDVAERFPDWSPDGNSVAYFSDRTGEYELYIRPSDGKPDQQQITKTGKVFRYRPVWSPDSNQIAFSDKTGSLFIVDIADGEPIFVDKDQAWRMSHYSWSPDSRWLAYSKRTDNYLSVIMIYDTKEHKTKQVTSNFYNDENPVFDPEGKYLFFCSNRTLEPVYDDLQGTWVYPNSTGIYAATLRTDVNSPIAPLSDEERPVNKKTKNNNNKKDSESEKGSDKDEKEQDKPEPVEIDFDGFEQRIVKLPIEAGNFGPLHAVKNKVLYLRKPAAGAAKPDEPSGTLLYYDLAEREEKTVICGINTYDLSANGKKVVYKSKSTYGIIDLVENQKIEDSKIATEKMKAWINPRQEWQQIFNEAWRIERDYFYDPNMHGVDWDAIKKRYELLLPYVVDREDLNYIIGEMIAELNASHTYVRGGDLERPEKISVGLLGCDFELDKTNNAYRIRKIYEGADWDAQIRSPLRQPGVDVKEGDYLLAVNNLRLDISRDPWAAFQGLADEVVTLTISSSADISEANEVVVKPMSSELRLRYLDWIESNRRKVDESTNGRVGYIYVPDTGRKGQNELVRQFIPQTTKDALIIDERFNSGGQDPDRFIELLNRPTLSYWARRDHRDWKTPFAHEGPKAMLINQWAGSGGDLFPYYFRKVGLGPLIGKRTWGGVIGISTADPQLIDGGFISAPSWAFWNTEGKWEVEGYGVEPDYDIENAPHKLAAGKDAQLEKAIKVILEMLIEEPPKKPKRPPYPNRSNKID